MGVYLNPEPDGFKKALNSQIYVDKSGLIAYTNKVFDTEQEYVCVSRPRRFGKSMTANMLAAYYSRGYDNNELFQHLSIAQDASYEKHRNRYNVIFLNMQKFLSRTHDVGKMESMIERSVLRDLLREYPDVDYFDCEDLISSLQDIYEEIKIPFVFIIDEWDCIFRENQNDEEAQKLYLDFLRNLLKDAEYVKLAYMTGILPVKKYGTHSALNMFDEFSMAEPDRLAQYVGFTETEVKNLCEQYHMDFTEIQRWYDGYQFDQDVHVYNPRSVVRAMLSQRFGSYWTKTETYEALRIYIEMNFKGLKDTIIELLAGGRKKINIGKFTNDMATFQSVDDVLTLLIHLGYLGYEMEEQEVFIPNSEVAGEFVNAIEGAGWEEVIIAIKESEELLQATWKCDEAAVKMGLERAHMETSILTYNDETALSYTLSLAYYCARVYYTVVRELPTGKGVADLVFLPRKNHLDKPAMVVELKWNQSVEGAIAQIKKQQYLEALKDYEGNVLMVGINYDVKSKEHSCKIEKLNKE